jgi:tetratricopeptide (TPR) repeat protein
MAVRFGSVRAMLELARSLARRGQEQQALGVMNEALPRAPNSQEVLSAYARLCLQTDAPVPSMRALEALVRMHPEEAEYWYLLGIARFQLASTEDSLAALQRSLELEPGRPLPLIALGLAYKSVKRFAEAKEVLGQSLQLLPGNVDALIALAEAEEGLRELEKAEAHVRRALERAQEAPEALYVLGKIRMSEGRFEEARDILLRSVERDPSSPRAHYQLSLAYARLRDRESSQKHLALYREARQEEEELLMEMRVAAGLGVGGMGRGG